MIKILVIILATMIVLSPLYCRAVEQPEVFKKIDAVELNCHDTAGERLNHYLQLRLHDARWKDYSKFITWTDEPSWDCNWVVSKYEIGTSKEGERATEIPVIYKRLGLYCYDFDFNRDHQTITLNYELVLRKGEWKINAPIPDYPDVQAEVLIKSLLSKATDKNESSQRQSQFKKTADTVKDALQR